MKIRDVSLMVTGAVGAIVIGLFLSTYFNKAEAQSAGAAGTPGVNPVIVTSASGAGGGANAGIIVVNDPANKTITAVSYEFTYTTGGANTNTMLGLSKKQTFTY